jgi:hypothetical protein
MPPYVTPGEKENKIEKFYSGVNRASLAGVISIFLIYYYQGDINLILSSTCICSKFVLTEA